MAADPSPVMAEVSISMDLSFVSSSCARSVDGKLVKRAQFRQLTGSRCLPRALPQDDANVVLAVDDERDIRIACRRLAVQFDQRHAAAHMAWIFHRDVIDG